MSRILALTAAARPQTTAALASALSLLVAAIALLVPRGSGGAATVVGIVGTVAMILLIVGLGVLVGRLIAGPGGGGS
jgi:lipopolysaccharide export LptBFGC system permease protein LptF